MWGGNSLEKTVMLGKLEGRRRRRWQRLDGITNSVDMSLSKLREKWRTGRPGVLQGFPDGSAGKDSTCNVGDLGSIPGLERSPGEGNGYPLQYFGLENSTDNIVPWGCKELDTTERVSFHFHHRDVTCVTHVDLRTRVNFEGRSQLDKLPVLFPWLTLT